MRKTYNKIKKGVALLCISVLFTMPFNALIEETYALEAVDTSDEDLDRNAYPFMEDTGEESDSTYDETFCDGYEIKGSGKVNIEGTDATLDGIYFVNNDHEHIVAGACVDNPSGYNLEYRWIACKEDTENWFEISPWVTNIEWLDWQPVESGNYAVAALVRLAGTEEFVLTETYVEYHKHIKDICQTYYAGEEGEGFLIGFESYDNPNQEYMYEMIVMDLSLLAAGSPTPWIHTTGQIKLMEGANPSDGKTMWTIWQPEYGYYLTLFRIHNADGDIIDEVCYGFENVPVVKKSWETTYGYSVIEPYLDDILRVSTNDGMTDAEKLRAAYLYVVKNYTYKALSANHPEEFTSAEYYAYVTMSTGYGNCYGFSSVFYYLALKIGYDATWVCGSVGTRKDPHGWVEIGGLIYDTELERYNNVNLYGVTNGHPYKYWY